MLKNSVDERLQDLFISLTKPRVAIAKFLSQGFMHVTAEEVYQHFLNENMRFSRATVYNTLNLFVSKGLLKQIIVNNGRNFYDTNLSEHCHLYDVDKKQLTDITRVPSRDSKTGFIAKLFSELHPNMNEKNYRLLSGEVIFYVTSEASV